MLTLIGKILGAAVTILQWLLSPEQVAKRKEAEREKVNQRLRDAVAHRDTAAVSTYIDRVRRECGIPARDE